VLLFADLEKIANEIRLFIFLEKHNQALYLEQSNKIDTFLIDDETYAYDHYKNV
jgi:hypothetical protein